MDISHLTGVKAETAGSCVHRNGHQRTTYSELVLVMVMVWCECEVRQGGGEVRCGGM